MTGEWYVRPSSGWPESGTILDSARAMLEDGVDYEYDDYDAEIEQDDRPHEEVCQMCTCCCDCFKSVPCNCPDCPDCTGPCFECKDCPSQCNNGCWFPLIKERTPA
jgi:hypothetical protein